jgi:glycine/D-amino acid oxidase-like deaminating enzyme
MLSDYLIIGQGITGTLLSRYLHKAGANCIVIDENKNNTASKVAAGLINPVTGRRLVKSWMIDELMPFAWKAYKQFGEELGLDCIRELSLVQFFNAPDMQEAFNRKLQEDGEFLSSTKEEEWRPYFNYPFGSGTITPCYVADAAGLIAAYRTQLPGNGKLLQEKFDSEQLHIHQDHVQYKDIKAQKVIFCEGEAGINNRWFSRLPYSLNKGEALIVQIPGLSTEHIYKFGHTLIPLNADEPLFWFGSSYEWTYADDLPSQKFRLQAEAELKRLLKLPYTIFDHRAAVRPANVERRPFVGLHPHFPQLGILNGMGTKGCSLAPYFANQLANHLTRNEPLLPEANVTRFQRTLISSEGVLWTNQYICPMSNQQLYSIPAKYRRMENLHILFWLVKDTCWCLSFKWLGIAMIFPTLLVAALICWRTRNLMSEFTHNLAVIFWITANSYWMITEFFGWPEETKFYALIPFGLGLVTLVYYYVFYAPRYGKLADVSVNQSAPIDSLS